MTASLPQQSVPEHPALSKSEMIHALGIYSSKNIGKWNEACVSLQLDLLQSPPERSPVRGFKVLKGSSSHLPSFCRSRGGNLWWKYGIAAFPQFRKQRLVSLADLFKSTKSLSDLSFVHLYWRISWSAGYFLQTHWGSGSCKPESFGSGSGSLQQNVQISQLRRKPGC